MGCAASANKAQNISEPIDLMDVVIDKNAETPPETNTEAAAVQKDNTDDFEFDATEGEADGEISPDRPTEGDLSPKQKVFEVANAVRFTQRLSKSHQARKSSFASFSSRGSESNEAGLAGDDLSSGVQSPERKGGRGFRLLSRENLPQVSTLTTKVNSTNAKSGMMVSLDFEVYGASGLARFPGDSGPGVLMEDHFGDGMCWRVRWVLTNCWGIYYTGLQNEFHLFCGMDKASVTWEPDCFNAKGRMPSMFFFLAPPSEKEAREQLLQFSSPRSRVLTSEEMF